MTALPAYSVFNTAICPRCSERKPVADFSPRSSYCRPCKNQYDAARHAARRNGTWAPKHRSDYVRHSAPLKAVAPAAPEPFQPGPDGALRAAIYDYFRANGFTQLRAKTEALITELAKNKRVELAREGWIA